MLYFKPSLKITSFNKEISTNFIKKFIRLGAQKPYKNLLKLRDLRVIKKKHTILRSPHVHKKARDQIEVQHVSHFFTIKPSFNWLFFLLNFKKHNNNSIKIDYKHIYDQTVYYKKK